MDSHRNDDSCRPVAEQAANNSTQKFANSPDLKKKIERAIMAALDAHDARAPKQCEEVLTYSALSVTPGSTAAARRAGT